jgi:hypothetical protein
MTFGSALVMALLRVIDVLKGVLERVGECFHRNLQDGD